MTQAFVLDASIALAWLHDGEATAASDHAREVLADGGEAYVPTLWRYELGNVLIGQERRGQLSSEAIEAYVDLLEAFHIYEEDAWPSVPSIVGHARIHELSGYDASYLIIAQRLALPLATNDAQLRRAAEDSEIDLL